MQRTHDELAGIVDLFGGLTRDELTEALVELAFRDGRDLDEAAVEDAVDAATADYRLLEVPHDGDVLVAPGPAAFPTVPDDADDLPHILDIDRRDVTEPEKAAALRSRLETDVAALGPGDDDRAETLLDVTYDAEVWIDATLEPYRDRIHARLDA
ncbi:DUF7109 family protein [Halocalculus aciditolerans]|uniref:Uncharacterized protein n=1 Tax=Halocalculus aciditolerans TaxID=1383812 RepID=A0A830F814_9EURY|nr:hypothetical protein [Halocalculus aciditolerans]GGL72495.1 hypothetical protein GCM10009039_33080 [Halocalculus aciditolerans]